MKAMVMAAAVAGLAWGGLAAAQDTQPVPGKRAHSPRLGKPAAQTTGTSPAAIKRASGGGVPHGPRTGDGKVRRSGTGQTNPAKPAAG